ncbi:MAG: HAMP domain-containing sensor histidine kinase [bacterium]|nr:HAMP domain-containing sensor histidine kinase [bacterium]
MSSVWSKDRTIRIFKEGSKEDKSKIFEPFFGRRGSAGMGLSIVKHIVDAHQGKIEENGEPDEGARFIICLPMKQRRAA